jgi:ABC-type multidrug transport system fused ATPase/permease subunit
MFAFFGYTFWIGMISPVSLAIYIVSLSLFTAFYKRPKKNNPEAYYDIWDTYTNHNTSMFTEMIHHNGNETLDKMKDAMLQLEKIRDTDKYNDSKFMDAITLIFNIAFIINCLIVSSDITIANVIIYIQYSLLMRNSVTSCINLFNQYADSKREYEKMSVIINGSTRRKELEQLQDFTSITIDRLEFQYPNSSNINNKPFSLHLENSISFETGEIVRLDGSSGHGKSTFVDAVNGIFPDDDYDSDAEQVSGYDETSDEN